MNDPIEEFHEKQRRIEEARANGTCIDCFNHKATLTFADSSMAMIHGFTERLCKCCYFRRVEKAYNDTKANYEKLGVELRDEGCR